MLLPKELRQSASRYADAHVQDIISGEKDAKMVLVEAYIQGVMDGREADVPPCAYPDTHLILDDAPTFDSFWNAYEKKVGKPKCEKLWGKLSSADKKAAMNYIPQYKQAQPDKQYRKNPETFLRNKSWNDELIFRNNNNGRQQQISTDQQERDFLERSLRGIVS